MTVRKTPARLGSDFVTGLLSHMGIQTKAQATESEGTITVRLDGEDPALDAIAANKDLVLAIAQLAGQAVSQAIEARARVFLAFDDDDVAPPTEPERSARPERGDRGDRGPRPERGDRPERGERGPRPESKPVSGDREAFLADMAGEIAEVVSRTGRRAVIEGLGSPERRLVHTALMDHGNVKTHSEGGEQNRYLLVEPLQ